MVEPQPILNWETFSKVAVGCGIQNSMVAKAAKYLHQLGSLVHFDERESGLDNIVILDR